VWAEAAKWLGKFEDGVLTTLDTDGYPVSVRAVPERTTLARVSCAYRYPELRAVEGPANLLCHFHNEKLWGLKAIQVKGRIEKHDDAWVFVTTTFNPPPKLAALSFIRHTNASAKKYLDKRGVDRPTVNWAALKEIQRRAKDRNG
jgi:hypothetical protein